MDNAPLVEDPFVKPWMVDRADDHYALDVSRASKEFGWRAEMPLEEGLKRTIEWYQHSRSSAPVLGSP